MPLSNRDRLALAGGSAPLVIPPFPRPEFSERFVKAFPDDVKKQLEHHREVEEWRKKLNFTISGTIG